MYIRAGLLLSLSLSLVSATGFLFPITVHAAIGDVPTNGLVGHWSFDENTGTNAADSSGNGYNATLVNSPTWVSGIAGSAVNFATSSTNQVTFPAGLQTTSFPTSGTLAFWIKGDFSVQTSGSIFDNNSHRNHVFVRTNSNNNLQIVLQDAAGNYLNQQGQWIFPAGSSITNVSVTANTWTHIAVVWDATNGMAYVYKNGSLAMSYFWGAYAPTWTPSAQVFKLSNSSSPFAGATDDVALYNRPLASTEISSIYAGTAALTADTTAPTAPTNLAGNGFSPSKVTLGWSAATDSVGIGGYIVYRNGAQAGYASSTALAYTDTGLATSTSYTYQVYAFDTSGNRSPVSNSITVSTNAANLLLKTTFEEESTVNTAEIGGWTKYGPNSDAVVVTTEQVRTGSQAVKFDFNYSDWNSTDTNYHQRAQISQSSHVYQTLGQTYWTAVSTYIPTSWENDLASNAELIWQFHGSSNGPSYGSSPPLALYINGDTQNINVRGATTTAYAVGAAPFATTIASFPLDADKGKWIDWVIKSNFNYSGGSIEVWKNGIQVAYYTGPNVYHQTGQTTEIGPWFNTGPYKWDWGNLATQVTNRTMYADEIRIADNTASCSDVTTAGGTLCDAAPSVTSIAITSSNTSRDFAKAGDVVTLSFTSNQSALISPTVTIAGRAASVVAGSNYVYTASTTLLDSDPYGPVTFNALVGNNTGLGTTTISSITVGSNVVVDNSSRAGGIRNTRYCSETVATFCGVKEPSLPISATAVTETEQPISSFAFTRPLQYLDHGEDVRQLQMFLNGNGFVVAMTGPGSIGKETPYFGPATQAALAKYQAANGIIPAIGYFGPKTKAFISGAITVPTPVTPTASSTMYTFTRNLEQGMEGEDVRVLQQYLNTHGFTVTASGPGSPGQEIDFFGPATQAALAKFQAANGITPSVGYFGPKTRIYIQAN